MNRAAVHRCPFCKSMDLEIEDAPGGDYWVGCNDCKAVGPTAKTQAEAIELWNAALRSLVPGPSLPCRHLDWCDTCNPALKART